MFKLQQELDRAKRAPYDGVSGNLPDWVPDSSKERFEELRRQLFIWAYTSGYITPEELEEGKLLADGAKECLDTYIKGESLPIPTNPDPNLWRDSEIPFPAAMEELVQIYKAVQHGEVHGSAAGLRELVGEDVVDAVKRKAKVQEIIPFPSPSDLQWEEITLTVKSNELMEIKVRGQRKLVTFADMGFRNRVKGDAPNEAWVALVVLASRSGALLARDARVEGFVENFKKRAQAIRTQMKAYFQLDDDPFRPYRERPRGYKTKFSIRDARQGIETSGPTPSGQRGGEDWSGKSPEEFFDAHPDLAPDEDEDSYR